MNMIRLVFSRLQTTLIFLLLGVTAAGAQDTLSLARAIQIGLRNNFDVQIEKLAVEIARNNNNWGQAGMYPTISLIGAQNNSVVQRKPANPFAVAGRNIADNVTGQLDFQLVLFDGFLIRLNKKRLEELEKLSYGNAVFVLETTVQSIILSYYQALLERERLNVLRVTQTLSKQRYDYVKLRKNLGGAISFDVLNEQSNYLTDSANVLRQEITLKNAKRDLNRLLNEDLMKSYTFVDSLQFENQDYVYEDLRQKMVSSNTNLQNQFVNQELLRNATQIQQSNLYPSLVMNVGATGSLDWLNAKFRPTESGAIVKSTTGYVNDDPAYPVIATSFAPEYRTVAGNSYGGYGNLALRFTVFNGGQIRRAIENAKVNEKIGQLTTDQLKRSLENDLMASFDLYNLRKQLVSITETKQQAARINLDLANERYRNGALSAIDLRIVQENFRNAALENYQAIFNSISSRVDLVRLTGGLVDKASVRAKN